MAKKITLVIMIGAVLIGVMIFVIVLLKKNNHVLYDRNFAWRVEADAVGGSDLLVRGSRIDEIRTEIAKLVIALNRPPDESDTFSFQLEEPTLDYPQIRILKIEQKTMHIEIRNAEQLTQRMGSSGAQSYLAAVTYTLTECPRIADVEFVFPEGDHAVPGIYNRESFTSYKIIAEK